MAREIDLIPRILAHHAGRAQRIASHQRVSVRPDALVLCPLAMAGEDTTIHIVAYGGIGQPPRLLWVPDPRYRDDQYQLFTDLGVEVEGRFQAARAAGEYPQLIVPSSAAVSHLDILADRLRYNQQNVLVRRFGELLTYPAERYPAAGQQALHAATGLLRVHWATGQQPGEDEHLGALLAWIDPPAGISIHAAVAAAEGEPRGVKTDPQFDRDILEPLVTAYNAARRRNAPAPELDRLGRLIRDALRPVVLPIYEDTQRAIRILLQQNLPPLRDLLVLDQREADEFEAFMASRDAGYPLPLRDSTKSAAFKLAAREEAEENAEAALLVGDRVARARGRLSGHVLVGRVTQVQEVKVHPRGREYYVEMESTQDIRRIRPRDELHWLDDPRLCLVVERINRTGNTTRVRLRIAKGMRSPGRPQVGATLELLKNVTDWSKLMRQRKHLKTRLTNTPWTHDPAGAIPPASARPGMPADPLAAVEALR